MRKSGIMNFLCVKLKLRIFVIQIEIEGCYTVYLLNLRDSMWNLAFSCDLCVTCKLEIYGHQGFLCLRL